MYERMKVERDGLKLDVERNPVDGWFFVTCEEHPEILLAGPRLSDLLDEAMPAIKIAGYFQGRAA